MVALRDQESGPQFTCPREEDFTAMFSALGNTHQQDQIRRDHPNHTHCYLLKESSSACTDLPRAFGEVAMGSVCPNNPYSRHQAELLRLELFQRLLAMTVDAHRQLRIHSLTDQAPRVEVTLAYAYQRWLEERQWPKL